MTGEPMTDADMKECLTQAIAVAGATNSGHVRLEWFEAAWMLSHATRLEAELDAERSRADTAEAERDAAVARAMPEARLIRTKAEAAQLPAGTYYVSPAEASEGWFAVEAVDTVSGPRWLYIDDSDPRVDPILAYRIVKPAEPSAPVAGERVCPVCGREESPGERCRLCPSDLRQEFSATGAPVAPPNFTSRLVGAADRVVSKTYRIPPAALTGEVRFNLKELRDLINEWNASPHLWSTHRPGAKVSTLEAENAALRAKMAEADRALAPFAGIGAWLFARDLPDAMPLVDILGINGASGVLTRGDFKAAHTARALLQGQGGGDHG